MTSTLQRLANLLFWFALAAYFGGLLTLGAIAAPALFHTVRDVQATSTLPGSDAANQLGGEIFGNILAHFQIIEVTTTALIIITAAVQSMTPNTGATGPRTRGPVLWHGLWGYLRLLLITLLVLVGLYDWLAHSPAIWHERALWRHSMTLKLPDADQHRAQFESLHHQSERLGQTKLTLLAALLIISAWRTYPTSRQNTVAAVK